MSSPANHRRPAAEAAAAETTYVLDRASVRAVDRAAIAEYGLPGLVLMENAARALAREALALLRAGPEAAARGRALIVCGSGNNGGDGWALARLLDNAGVAVAVAALRSPRPETDAGVNCAVCRAMGITEVPIDDLDAHADAALIVDAIFGTGLDRPITGDAVRVIEWINAREAPVLAVDVPSGLDCDTGEVHGIAVRATRTVSFVGAKPAFGTLPAQRYVGEVVIGDIGAPRALTERFGKPVPSTPPRARD